MSPFLAGHLDWEVTILSMELGRPRGSTRRRFTEGLRADAVALGLSGDRPVADMARVLEIGASNLGDCGTCHRRRDHQKAWTVEKIPPRRTAVLSSGCVGPTRGVVVASRGGPDRPAPRLRYLQARRRRKKEGCRIPHERQSWLAKGPARGETIDRAQRRPVVCRAGLCGYVRRVRAGHRR